MTAGATGGAGAGLVVVWHRRPLVREGLAVALQRRVPVWEATAVATPDDLAEVCRSRRASAAIVDLDERGDQGDRLWEALASLDGAPNLRLVGLYRSLAIDTARRAVEAGIRSVVGLDAGLDAVVEALTPGGFRAATFAGPSTGRPALEEVEQAVLRLVSVGMTARKMAGELGMTPSQIDRVKQQVFAKLGVQHQSHALAVALRDGLLREPE